MSDEKLDTEVRRGQIVAAALELVASGGVGRLSIAAVAGRVGLVPSGIYRHFKNKDEILAAVLDLVEARLLANAEAARQETTDPLARLRGLLDRHVRFIREARAVPRIVFSEDAHGGDPDRLGRVRRIVGLYLGQIEAFVRQGQREGRLRGDLDPPTVALLFLGMVIPAGVLWHLSDGQFNVARHAEEAWRMFRRAIVPAAGGALDPPSLTTPHSESIEP